MKNSAVPSGTCHAPALSLSPLTQLPSKSVALSLFAGNVQLGGGRHLVEKPSTEKKRTALQRLYFRYSVELGAYVMSGPENIVIREYFGLRFVCAYCLIIVLRFPGFMCSDIVLGFFLFALIYGLFSVIT